MYSLLVGCQHLLGRSGTPKLAIALAEIRPNWNILYRSSTGFNLPREISWRMLGGLLMVAGAAQTEQRTHSATASTKAIMCEEKAFTAKALCSPCS